MYKRQILDILRALALLGIVTVHAHDHFNLYLPMLAAVANWRSRASFVLPGLLFNPDATSSPVKDVYKRQVELRTWTAQETPLLARRNLEIREIGRAHV